MLVYHKIKFRQGKSFAFLQFFWSFVFSEIGALLVDYFQGGRQPGASQLDGIFIPAKEPEKG